MRESSVQKAIVAALESAGVLVMRNSVGSRRGYKMGLGTGSTDLVCLVYPGKAVFIEVKSPGSKHDPSHLKRQELWRAKVKMHGAIAGVATSPEEALALVQEARHALG